MNRIRNLTKKIIRTFFKKTVKFLSWGLGLGQVKFIAKIYTLFYSLAKDKKSGKALVNGFVMHLDRNDALGLSVWGNYEEEQTKLVEKEVKKGFWVVDVGANIGYYTLLMSRLVGDSGKVFAFEPDDENFSILKKNIDVNHCSNVVAEQCAVSDSAGEAKLYKNRENTADSRVFWSKGHEPSMAVRTVNLDDYFGKEAARINFIKMDIQGFEVYALRGMRKILAAARNLKVMTEFWPKAVAESGVDPSEFLKIFRGAGFAIFKIDEAKKQLTPVVTDEKFLESIAPEKDRDANLFCVKNL